jgi:hypothetical protein
MKLRFQLMQETEQIELSRGAYDVHSLDAQV